jgi:2-keto-3-deoxy-L-rhamnonate aldolase RhmA
MNIELESAEDYRNLETFLHRCKSVRSNPWVVSTGQDDAKKLLEMGFEFISQGSDVSFVSQGLAKLVSERDKLERVGYGSRD